MSERFIADRGLRLAQLRMARSELLCYPLWSSKYRFDPWWGRMVACPFVFCMGPINLLSALTGLYFGEAISWLGWKQVCFKCWIEDAFGIERDPDLSRRIVDPRHRLAALEAIEMAKAAARDKGKGR